jgi:hypothetical protein
MPISELAGDDENYIEQDPQAKAAVRDQLKKPARVSATVKAMKPEIAE